MASVKVEIPVADMNATLAAFGRESIDTADRAMGVGLEALVSEAQIEAPVKTGFLKERHFVQRIRKGFYLIGAAASYALAVHETHPTRRRWFVNAVKLNFRRVMEGALRLEVRKLRGGRS